MKKRMRRRGVGCTIELTRRYSLEMEDREMMMMEGNRFYSKAKEEGVLHK